MFEIRVLGMTSAECAKQAQAALERVAGLAQADVRYPQGTATFTVTSARALRDAFAALEQAGYPGALGADTRDWRETDAGALRRAAVLAFVLTLPIVLLESGSRLFPTWREAIEGSIGTFTSWQIQSLLAAVVLLGPGLRVFRRGVPALLRGRPDADSLIALGAAMAYLYSALVIGAPELMPEHARVVYFEYGCALIALAALGRWRSGGAPEAVGFIPRYTLALFGVAGIAALVWSFIAPGSALAAALGVLIIGCPAALGLAAAKGRGALLCTFCFNALLVPVAALALLTPALAAGATLLSLICLLILRLRAGPG